ncbi:MAG: aminotransferase class I/II-fold pyridoxal phosphate-dependent enzyme [Eggerthellaceae bacterium]|jgi:DNA-binding transcriptional MocR family regulator
MFASLNHQELTDLEAELKDEYAQFKARDLKLNMARGKPSQAQLDLSVEMLSLVTDACDCFSEDGTDCRNYGVLDGLPEAKRLMAVMLDDEPDHVIVGGSSSLTLIYNTLSRFMSFGSLGTKPWAQIRNRKWLCPVPGYDRHFAITETFGFEMIPVPSDEHGPNMDIVEELVRNDSDIKGIWCVPKYSNPTGAVYSNDVVLRLAAMECAAPDFKIFWDNAYGVHHLYGDHEVHRLLDIGAACRKTGNENRYIKFASTSKVTFPGAGVSALASSPENLDEIRKYMGVATIGYDKINQLRHVRFLQDAEGLAAHMKKQAEIIRPKFDLVEEKLEAGLSNVGSCSWTHPDGGYFISFNAPEGTARRIVNLAKEAGVTMTGPGATWPYKQDPYDSNIRIAPTLPPLEELNEALDVFVCCVKLAFVEKLLSV